jgi:excinuclease UvrABC helicase subunit UvrB
LNHRFFESIRIFAIWNLNWYLNFLPTGDQPEAIKELSQNIKAGEKFQTLLGVTGSWKNFYGSERCQRGKKTNTRLSAQ